ncbi:hypothetical protein M3Y99_00059900 [Aphelenchoides fujianensis]|nr:hypothetical protein M3Y99_00059900 [Aphelenchoides fujianensis]
MTVSKYWGDEKQTDAAGGVVAVYSIFLKKVRYVPPPGYEGLPHYRPIDPDHYYLTHNGGNDDHLQWETIRERVIKAGTREKLIESLVGSDDKMDSRHFNVFFGTYRAFARPADVAAVLMAWFERLDCEECGSKRAITVQSTIRSILVCWLDMHPEDFFDHDDHKFPLLASVIDFARRHTLQDLKQKARKLRDRFKLVAQEGGLVAHLPSIDQYVYSLDYDPNDLVYAQERAQMFDISKDNCVQIAEQLTYWDAVSGFFSFVAFLRSCSCCSANSAPTNAKGAIWGQRNKKHANNVYSVRATIDQFNSLSQRVMTSIVLPDCRAEFRARIIEKWIEIAKELRALKNYSSLKAVISSLQSEPVFRIKSAWSCVSKGSNLLFRELSGMFDGEEVNSGEKPKERADLGGSGGKGSRRVPQCRRTKSDVNLSDTQGSVPYLGNFLTDLTMLDQALPDSTDEGLINFEKRRREFEVMAKIRLFQSAARSYTLPMDHAFCAWFYYLPSLNENDCFQRSLEVEPAPTNNSTPDFRRTRNSNSNGKMNSITKMFGHLDIRGSPFLNGQTSNDSGSGLSEDSWTPGQNGSPQSPESSAVAMALISRGRMLASPAVVVPGPSGAAASAAGGWRMTPPSASEFNPQHLQFSPHHSAQRSDPTNGRLSDFPPAIPAESSLQLPGTTSSMNGSRCATPQNGSFISADVTINSKQSSTRSANGQFNRKLQCHQSTSSTSSMNSSGSAQLHSSSCTSPTSNTSTAFSNGITPPAGHSLNFHLARVGLDDALQTENSGANYKCIKVENGDRMLNLIERALEKHMLNTLEKNEYCLVQLLPDGGEFRLPDQCNPFYAVAPDPTSPMLNFLLRRKDADERPPMAPSAKKLNRQKRSALLRWNSGYL